MKLDKAIGILDIYQKHPIFNRELDFIKAIRLGIEALKRHKAQECCQANVIVGPLPGEDSFIDTSRSKHTIKKLLESPLGRKPK